MAPSRGKGKPAAKAIASSSRRGGRRSTRSQAKTDDDDVPDVYTSMLAEADAPESHGESDRPLKRRKVATPSKTAVEKQPATASGPSTARPRNGASEATSNPPRSSIQTVEDSSESEGSDLEFEDVDLEGAPEGPADGIEDLAIAVQPESSTKRAAQNRRKPASTIEKAQRLLTHKLHVLCLLTHCMYVNGRCNNAAAQTHLRQLLSSKTVSYLNPKKTESQFQRNRSFMDGLQQAMDTFNAEYRSSGAGLMRPHWTIDGESGRDYDSVPVDRSDFITAAQNLEGTQDMGNQLFCSMLRSAGVDARVVCSLQVLPYTSVPKAATPKKSTKETFYAMASSNSPSKNNANTDDTAVSGSSTIGKVPSARRRLGQPTFTSAESSRPATTPKKKAKPAPKLSYPVFWIEAFNEAQQKWIPIDPVVTHTVNKASKLEPPASYDLNQLTYVIAFEDDGSAQDVTRRYAKAYNAKTRRQRVEASLDGAKWFKKAMRLFRRTTGALDRDQVEDAELAQKEAREGMPGNVLDFKDHPYYALERHLKRHEVIHPKREVGKVNAGTAAKPRMEPVYRRKDVFICRSADKWYRIGREVKEGEQPLKHVPARARRQKSVHNDDAGEEAAMTGLYAPYQTQVYIPPPVQRGRIPKNVYGNLDIYTPSMIPAGGVHIRHALAQRAAKLLRVDYADAVTGFKFQGRHGTAIMEGVVVAQAFENAVRTVIEGFEEEAIEEESKARSLQALRVWKRFLTGLRIRERVSTYGDGTKQPATEEEEEEADDAATFFAGPLVEDDRPMVTAGQYSLVELMAPTSKQPKTRKRKVVDDDSDEYDQPMYDADGEGGGFFPDANMPDADGPGGFMAADRESEEPGGFVVDDNDGGVGGGSIPERGDDQGGGFMPEGGDDGEGGGFLPEGTDEEGGGFIPEQQHDADGDEDLFGDGNAANEPTQDEDEALVDQRQPTPTDESMDEPPKDVDAKHNSAGLDTIEAQSTPHDAPLSAVQAGTAPPQDDDESDKGSLLSHDPEDDDAEPDWLESD